MPCFFRLFRLPAFDPSRLWAQRPLPAVLVLAICVFPLLFHASAPSAQTRPELTRWWEDPLASPEAAAPFAALPLTEVADVLESRHGGLTGKISGRTSAEFWGEDLPGVVRFLPGVGKGPRVAAPPCPGGGYAEPTRPSTDQLGTDQPHVPPVLALTLDACGGRRGSSYDREIIELLRDYGVPATIFVTGYWMRANPGALAELAADPLFEIAAHGARHRPCSVTGREAYGVPGTASFEELVAEVEGNARAIEQATGRRPLWFRSGTAHYDAAAVRAIRDLGLHIAGYSLSGDLGATLPAERVAGRLLEARPGDIILLHLNRPACGTSEGLRRALPRLLEGGAVFVRLSDNRLRR